ncbi:MAG: Spy/CpxP family protein refolding chaperone [Candidatus Cloacimonetes bacterium]|nr:Spy/CpxP family protein refolding chaperone [Candidatus Cloacimonadota bacterium]
MKRLLLITLALLVVGVLLAQGLHKNEMEGCRQGKMDKGMKMVQGERNPQKDMMMMHIMQRLDLTEKQQDQMEDMRIKLQKDNITIKAEIEKKEIDARVAMKDLNFAEAKKITRAIFNLKADMKDKHFDQMTSCWNLLTPEQQSEAKELMKNGQMLRKGMKQGEGREKRGMHHRMMMDDDVEDETEDDDE